jgi:hypothetical protein
VAQSVGGKTALENLLHKLAYNIHVKVRAFFFGRVLEGCYRKEGVINQNCQGMPAYVVAAKTQ